MVAGELLVGVATAGFTGTEAVWAKAGVIVAKHTGSMAESNDRFRKNFAPLFEEKTFVADEADFPNAMMTD